MSIFALMNKKICLLVDSIFSIGGVQRVTAVIAKELAKEYDVTIVTFDNPKDKDTNLYGLHEADIQYRFFSYPKSDLSRIYVAKYTAGYISNVNPSPNGLQTYIHTVLSPLNSGMHW